MNCIYERIENVYSRWPLFNAEAAKEKMGCVPEIGVLSIKAMTTDDSSEIDESLRICTAEFRTLLIRSDVFSDSYRIFLFVCHGTWQPDTAMVRYKKLWKDLSQFNEMRGFRQSPEVEINSSLGLRFAGMAEVGSESFLTATRIAASTMYSAFLLLSKNEGFLAQDFIRDLYNVSFPSDKGRRVDIPNVCLFRCREGDFVTRCGFEVDRSLFYIDTFAVPDVLGRLSYAG